MLDIQELKNTMDRMAMITGMLRIIPQEQMKEKENKMKNVLIDKLIQDLVVLKKILEEGR